MLTSPEISVILMTFNRQEALRRCLESLAGQTLHREAFEIVLVDVSHHPANDLVKEFEQNLDIRHVIGSNLGVAGNRNRGAEHASAEFIAFIDDDCVAYTDWLAKIKVALKSNPNSLIGGAVDNPFPDNVFATAGQVITEAVDAFYNPANAPPRFFPGLNFAVPREAYRRIGGCDPEFGRLAAEDRDFADRWRSAGGSLVKCSEAVVCHEHRRDLRGFIRQYFNYGRGAWRYHSLCRQRNHGGMAEDIKLHTGLMRYLRKPLENLSLGMRVKVVVLLGVWQTANLAGFLWQSAVDSADKARNRSIRIT
jgi:GT2 family glycosyltransferase